MSLLLQQAKAFVSEFLIHSNNMCLSEFSHTELKSTQQLN